MLRRGTCSAPNLRVSSVFFHLPSFFPSSPPLPPPLLLYASFFLLFALFLILILISPSLSLRRTLFHAAISPLVSANFAGNQSLVKKKKRNVLTSTKYVVLTYPSTRLRESERARVEAERATKRKTNDVAFLPTSLVTNWRALLLSFPLPPPPPFSPPFREICEGAKVRVTKRYDARTSEHTIMVGYRLFFWHSRLRFYLLLASNERALAFPV